MVEGGFYDTRLLVESLADLRLNGKVRLLAGKWECDWEWCWMIKYLFPVIRQCPIETERLPTSLKWNLQATY